MNIATASQLPLDFPKDPDVDGPTILRVVPVTEPAPVERLATVHRLVTTCWPPSRPSWGLFAVRQGRSESDLP